MTLSALKQGLSPGNRTRPLWYLELAVIGAFYGIYSWVRNQFGSAAVSPAEAQANAVLVIDWERSIGRTSSATSKTCSSDGCRSSSSGTCSTASSISPSPPSP